jgi:2,3-bisphosphoglycerate-dependent phosphoglycerate mutase
MDLFLIRHGQSEADILNVHEGRADFPLTELGIGQARAMARWMSGEYALDRIYASTLKRAAQTAQALADACGLPVHWEDDLMERDNGLLAGLAKEEADRLYPPALNMPIHREMYGKEPLLDFRCRAERVLSKILEESIGLAAVAIVSHGGMINQLWHCLLRLPIESCIAFTTSDTGIHGFRITEKGRSVLFANNSSHLFEIK